MADDFDHDVEQWFDDLEGQLAPAGRVTPARLEDDEGEAGLGPKLDPKPVMDLATMALTGLEAQSVESAPDSVWTEVL